MANKYKLDLDALLEKEQGASPKIIKHSSVETIRAPHGAEHEDLWKPNPFLRFFAFVISVAFFVIIPIGLLKGVEKLNTILAAFNISISPNDVSTFVVATPQLKTDPYGRTNVLFLGVDSRGDIDKSLLRNTDSIMVLSYEHRTHRLFMLSFPRDLYVKFPNTYYHNKINAVFAYGERLKPGHGIEYLKQLIEDLTGLKIQYYAMVNFDAFRTIINKLGGIDVYVKRSFVDYLYPNGKGGVMTVRFTKGWNHFDGERALEYARSRKAAGPEGSDFARARRQQQVISAAMDKIKKKGITDPKFFYDILKTISKNVKTSKITPLDIQAALTLLKKGKPETHSLVLDPSIGNYTLIGRGNTTLYTLVPKVGLDDWSLIKRYINDWFSCPEIVEQNPTIYVANAGDTNFWADYRQIANRFPYFKIVRANNLSQFSKKISTSPTGKYKCSAQFISKQLPILDYFDNKEFSTSYPKMFANIKNLDLLIILGNK